MSNEPEDAGARAARTERIALQEVAESIARASQPGHAVESYLADKAVESLLRETPEDPLGLEARYPNQQRATEPGRLAQDGEGKESPGKSYCGGCGHEIRVKHHADFSGCTCYVMGPGEPEPAPPGPRFGERARALIIEEDGFDVILADTPMEAAALLKQDLRQRIEAAVDRFSRDVYAVRSRGEEFLSAAPSEDRPEDALLVDLGRVRRRVVESGVLLAALAEIFGERLAESLGADLLAGRRGDR